MHATRLVLLGALMAAAVVLSGCGGEPFQPTHTGVVPLEGPSSAGQTFRSLSGEVRGVDLLVATYSRPADPDGTLTVIVRAAPGGAVLASAALPGHRLADNTWVGVAFEGAPVTVGERAAIEVTWEGADPVALRANVPPPAIEGDRLLNDPYRGGELLRDGRPAAGDLAFRVAGRSGPLAVGSEVARFARGAASRLRGDPPFALMWFLLAAGATAAAVWGLRTSARRPAG